MALVPVHGGLPQPVDRVLPLSKRRALQVVAAELPGIQVSRADMSVVYRIADGTLSPLTGPMDERDFNQVLDSWTIVRGYSTYAWSIPTILPITSDEAAQLKVGSYAALINPAGEIFGTLAVRSVYEWNKTKYLEKVYRTERSDHPGGDMVLNDERTMLVGGEIEVLPQPENPHFGEFVLTPNETRTLISENKWEAALAFQTRNPLHRAHEYALVYGVESLTRQGLFAGAVLNPLVGELKGDDVDAETRMHTYAALLENKALGEGDADRDLWGSVGYEIADVLRLAGLDQKMYYGGPAEAIMHAIYRQNHGFSHIVIGRKHADAPYHDKTPIWGDFDAQEVFDDLVGTLHTQPVKVGFAAWYDSMGRVDLMEQHPDEKPFFISGTAVRQALMRGERPDPRIMRETTADILIEAYQRSSMKPYPAP
jgi:sulfate adenylyltransferase